MDNILNMSNLELWSALIALVVPWATAAINRSDWGSGAKFVTFIVVCAVAAAGTTAFTTGIVFELAALVRSLLIIATLASVYYQLWKPAVKAAEQSTG